MTAIWLGKFVIPIVSKGGIGYFASAGLLEKDDLFCVPYDSVVLNISR